MKVNTSHINYHPALVMMVLCHHQHYLWSCLGVQVNLQGKVIRSSPVVCPCRYSSAGRSLLEPLMQRYWEWLVGRVPSWIAPNLITIIGLATNVFTTLVLIYYCPTATEQVSRHSETTLY